MKNKGKFEKASNSSQNTVVESSIKESISTAKEYIKQDKASDSLAFSKKNYGIMLFGLAIIILGFFIMTLDKEDFGFGFMGLTLGPIIAFSGFLIEFYAILKK